MLNVNFMGKLPSANKVTRVLETDAKNFFPNSTLVTESAKEKVKGLTEAEIKSYLDSRQALPADTTAIIEKAQAKAAAESYAKSHGNIA